MTKVSKPAKKTQTAEKPLTTAQKLDAIGIDAICAHIASGESLSSWCRANQFAVMSVSDWIARDEARNVSYARACEVCADAIFDVLDDVSDEAVNANNPIKVAGLRLKADNIKWKLARMNARKYGDRLQNEHSGPNGGAVPVSLSVSFVKP